MFEYVIGESELRFIKRWLNWKKRKWPWTEETMSTILWILRLTIFSLKRKTKKASSWRKPEPKKNVTLSWFRFFLPNLWIYNANFDVKLTTIRVVPHWFNSLIWLFLKIFFLLEQYCVLYCFWKLTLVIFSCKFPFIILFLQFSAKKSF